jgi:hypothetical protein
VATGQCSRTIGCSVVVHARPQVGTVQPSVPMRPPMVMNRSWRSRPMSTPSTAFHSWVNAGSRSTKARTPTAASTSASASMPETLSSRSAPSTASSSAARDRPVVAPVAGSSSAARPSRPKRATTAAKYASDVGGGRGGLDEHDVVAERAQAEHVLQDGPGAPPWPDRRRPCR